LLLQQQKQGVKPGSAAAAVKAGIWRRQQQQQQEQQLGQSEGQHHQQLEGAHSSTTASVEAVHQASSAVVDAAVAQQRAEAAGMLRQAQQHLQEAGVLKLPRTLLAWEDESAAGQIGGEEPAMHLHRGLLPPNHERPERLYVIEARLRAAGLMGECACAAPVS
jgi:hypothetical protein